MKTSTLGAMIEGEFVDNIVEFDGHNWVITNWTAESENKRIVECTLSRFGRNDKIITITAFLRRDQVITIAL